MNEFTVSIPTWLIFAVGCGIFALFLGIGAIRGGNRKLRERQAEVDKLQLCWRNLLAHMKRTDISHETKRSILRTAMVTWRQPTIEEFDVICRSLPPGYNDILKEAKVFQIPMIVEL